MLRLLVGVAALAGAAVAFERPCPEWQNLKFNEAQFKGAKDAHLYTGEITNLFDCSGTAKGNFCAREIELPIRADPTSWQWQVTTGTYKPDPSTDLEAVWDKLGTFFKASSDEGPFVVSFEIKNDGPTGSGVAKFEDAFDEFLLKQDLTADDFFKPRDLVKNGDDAQTWANNNLRNLARASGAPGWPTLGEMLGKVVCIVSGQDIGSDTRKEQYARTKPWERLCFADIDWNDVKWGSLSTSPDEGDRIIIDIEVDDGLFRDDSWQAHAQKIAQDDRLYSPYIMRGYPVDNVNEWDKAEEAGINILATNKHTGSTWADVSGVTSSTRSPFNQVGLNFQYEQGRTPSFACVLHTSRYLTDRCVEVHKANAGSNYFYVRPAVVTERRSLRWAENSQRIEPGHEADIAIGKTANQYTVVEVHEQEISVFNPKDMFVRTGDWVGTYTNASTVNWHAKSYNFLADADRPAVAMYEDKVTFVYRKNGKLYSLSAIFDVEGKSFNRGSARQIIDATDLDHPDVVMSNTGKVTVVWAQGSGSNTVVKAKQGQLSSNGLSITWSSTTYTIGQGTRPTVGTSWDDAGLYLLYQPYNSEVIKVVWDKASLSGNTAVTTYDTGNAASIFVTRSNLVIEVHEAADSNNLFARVYDDGATTNECEHVSSPTPPPPTSPPPPPSTCAPNGADEGDVGCDTCLGRGSCNYCAQDDGGYCYDSSTDGDATCADVGSVVAECVVVTQNQTFSNETTKAPLPQADCENAGNKGFCFWNEDIATCAEENLVVPDVCGDAGASCCVTAAKAAEQNDDTPAPAATGFPLWAIVVIAVLLCLALMCLAALFLTKRRRARRRTVSSRRRGSTAARRNTAFELQRPHGGEVPAGTRTSGSVHTYGDSNSGTGAIQTTGTSRVSDYKMDTPTY